ncbi:MAG: glutaminyl-peptide cyclotransferase [Acidobacteriota bacterium]
MSHRAGALLALCALWACPGEPGDVVRPDATPTVQEAGFVARHPHDPEAFTQGLFFHRGRLYEGTGRRGESVLREVEIPTGRVVREVPLPDRLFGEGIALHDGHVFQLTWTAGVGFVYDLGTFREVRRFDYPGEGWGLTGDGRRLIMSDGTATLRFIEPDSFRTTRHLLARERGDPVERLNELEYIRGEVWANVWQSDDIVRIDPGTGEVLDRIDLSDLVAVEQPRGFEAVLNGIAHDPRSDRVFLTGKLWRHVYEYRRSDLVDRPEG